MTHVQCGLRVCSVLVLGSALGCSDGTTDEPRTGQQLACDALDLDEPENGTQVEVVLPLEPGEEREVCQLVRLDRDVNLHWSDGVYTKGSHHGLVMATSYKGTLPAVTRDGQTIDGTLVHDCATPSALWDTAGNLAGGHPQDMPKVNFLPRGSMPDHVALRMKKDDYVLVNFHMLNRTHEPMSACFKANLNGIDGDSITEEVGAIFWYNPFITVPALGQATARMACELPADISVRTVVSHGHARLDGYSARLLDASPSQAGRVLHEVYETTQWEDPMPRMFNPEPLQIRNGQWIDYECHYSNRETRNVAQGFQTTDEMCTFSALYWPRNRELEDCGINLKSTQNMLYIGSGTKKGSEVVACVLGIPPEEALYQGGGAETSELRFTAMSCFTQACPQIAPEATAFVRNCEAGKPPTPECVAALNALNAAECD